MLRRGSGTHRSCVLQALLPRSLSVDGSTALRDYAVLRIPSKHLQSYHSNVHILTAFGNAYVTEEWEFLHPMVIISHGSRTLKAVGKETLRNNEYQGAARDLVSMNHRTVTPSTNLTHNMVLKGFFLPRKPFLAPFNFLSVPDSTVGTQIGP